MPEEIFVVLTLCFFAGMAYWQLSPFYPAFLKRKGLDKVWVGVMLSIYALSFLVTAYFTGTFILRWTSRLNGCFIGGTLIVINLLGIGLLDAFESKPVILVASTILQILGGIGNGINVPSTMAMLSSFKARRDVYIGYFELVNGLSALIGPLAGSTFYWFMGFPGPYVILGSAYGIALLFFC